MSRASAGWPPHPKECSCGECRIAELETALAADLCYTELPDCIKRDPVRDSFLIRQANQLQAQRERTSELDRTVTNQYNTIAELEAKHTALRNEAEQAHERADRWRDGYDVLVDEVRELADCMNQRLVLSSLVDPTEVGRWITKLRELPGKESGK